MANLYFIGNGSRTFKFVPVPFSSVIEKLKDVRLIGLDTETNVVESILLRRLRVISISWDKGASNAVFEWDYLDEREKAVLLEVIRTKKCIIHNASFDYQVFKTVGLTLENVYCTYLGEQILSNGFDKEAGHHGLQRVLKRRFDLDISKAEQLTFGEGGPYEDDQIRYAAMDTIKLENIYYQQIAEMKSEDTIIGQMGNKGLRKTLWWENEFSKVVGDMESEGVLIHKDDWYKATDSIQPVYDEELKILNELLLRDFKPALIKLGKFAVEDTFNGDVWTTSTKKLKILNEYFHDLDKTSKSDLKKYLKANDPNFPHDEIKTANGKDWTKSDYLTTLDGKFTLLKILALVDSSNKEDLHNRLNGFVLSNMREFMVENDVLTPKGALTFNWASPIQRLFIFQVINPGIEKTGKDILIDFVDNHEVIAHYLRWSDTEYKLKNFGRVFYDKHVDIDGRHRSRYKQILKTGRISSSNCNVLNVPNDLVYRSCFIPRPGKTLVGADYDAEELQIIAVLSGETSWIQFLESGKDLHSLNAKFMFGEKWIRSTLPDCEFEKTGRKCKCPDHKTMRVDGKTVVFGSLYGGGAMSLGFRLKKSTEEAQELLDNFFAGVPRIKAMMDRFGNFAVNNGKIIEPVLGRVKYYDKWKLAVDKERGAVARQSLNFPIQSSGGAILKIFAVLLRRWINHNGYNGSITLLLLVHDESLVECFPDLVEITKPKVEYYMNLASKLAGFDIGVEANDGASWNDCH